MEVDLPRQRIGLSMRLDDEPGQARGGRAGAGDDRSGQRGRHAPAPAKAAPAPAKAAPAPANSAFADALSRALKN